MIKKLFFLIFLYSTTIWAQTPDDPFEKLYMKTLTEIAAKDMPKALKIADSMTVSAADSQHKGRGLMLTASLYMQQSKYDESIKLAEKAKDILNETENYNFQAKIHGLLATEYRIIGLLNKSNKYAETGLKISDKITDPKVQAQVKSLFLQEKAYYLINLKKTDASKILLESLKYLSKTPQDIINIGRTYQLLGDNYLQLNKYELSEKNYLKAIEILPEMNIGSILSYIGIGRVKTKQKQYPEAEKYLLKALKFSENADHPEAKRWTYESLGDYYEQSKQYQKASIYRKKYVETFDKIEYKYKSTIDNNFNKIDSENQQYETGNAKKNLIILVISLLALTFIIIFIIYRKKHRQEYQKFKTIINHYKEKEEYVLESKVNTAEIEETENEEEKISAELGTVNKQADIAINKETETKILEQLDQFEKDKMFIHNYISLSYLATEFNTNIRYISYVVKKYKNTDFKNYINKLRINYIIHQLNTSEKYRKYKVGALAEECGFTSHSSFTTIFKSITGISPSTFISFIEQEEAKKTVK
jgi:AraC-like DNA-binding protein